MGGQDVEYVEGVDVDEEGEETFVWRSCMRNRRLLRRSIADVKQQQRGEEDGGGGGEEGIRRGTDEWHGGWWGKRKKRCGMYSVGRRDETDAVAARCFDASAVHMGASQTALFSLSH